MRINRSEPGAIVSAAAHAALLLLTLVVFSDATKLDEAQDSVPVEMLTDQQFSQIVKGDKEAKLTQPAPPKADKAAPVEERKPTPAIEAKNDVPTPPPPLKRIPDPGEDDQPAPTPPKRPVAALTPPPPPPLPPKAEPPDPPKPEADAIDPPKPPPRPQSPKQDPKPAPDQKPLDKVALAKELEALKAEDPPKPKPRPKSGDETDEPKHKYDPTALAKLLQSKEPPGARPSTAQAPNQTASIGAPTANAPKMSPSMMGQLEGLIKDQYRKCWTYLGLGEEKGYIPKIDINYSPDGRLLGDPRLSNPPGDPNLRNLAESAMRAVRRCDPLRIPAQFAPYYKDWKFMRVDFDPQDMSG